MKRKYFLIVGAIAILIGIGFTGYRLHQHRQEEMRMAEEQREIADAYRWLHYAMGIFNTRRRGNWDLADGWDPEFLDLMSNYRPLDSFSELNEHGIFSWPYLVLRMYYHRGGVYLPYDKLIDYFATEFEPDGERRLYNNGRHPEIEAFVVWMRAGLRNEMEGEFSQYRSSLNRIHRDYFAEHGITFRELPHLHQLSPQMLDALARAESDPNYILDLTSLQEAGY